MKAAIVIEWEIDDFSPEDWKQVVAALKDTLNERMMPPPQEVYMAIEEAAFDVLNSIPVCRMHDDHHVEPHVQCILR